MSHRPVFKTSMMTFTDVKGKYIQALLKIRVHERQIC